MFQFVENIFIYILLLHVLQRINKWQLLFSSLFCLFVFFLIFYIFDWVFKICFLSFKQFICYIVMKCHWMLCSLLIQISFGVCYYLGDWIVINFHRKSDLHLVNAVDAIVQLLVLLWPVLFLQINICIHVFIYTCISISVAICSINLFLLELNANVIIVFHATKLLE